MSYYSELKQEAQSQNFLLYFLYTAAETPRAWMAITKMPWASPFCLLN